jgi:hypothetical protein
MIDAILSGLGGPREPFPWAAVLVLVGLIVVYGLVEYAFCLAVRRLWRRLKHRGNK